jgi:hypothetical protein
VEPEQPIKVMLEEMLAAAVIGVMVAAVELAQSAVAQPHHLALAVTAVTA